MISLKATEATTDNSASVNEAKRRQPKAIPPGEKCPLAIPEKF
jgi:hypothetical protein